MSLDYPDDLDFGIPEIDEQHKYLFDLYNEFSNSLDDSRCKDRFYQLFSCLENFTSYHFRFEEILIERSNYPNAEVHLQEHIQAIDVLKQFKKINNSVEPSKELLLSLKRQLIRVLINHVKNCDVRLCEHLLEFKKEHNQSATVESIDITFKKIGEILVDSHIINQYTLDIALEKQKHCSQKIGEILVKMGAAKAEDIVEAYAIQIGMLKKHET